MRDGDCRTFPSLNCSEFHRAWNHVTPSGSIQTLARIRFYLAHAGHHADGHARHRTRTAPTVDAWPEAGGPPSMRRTAASGTQIERAQLRRVRMAKSQQKGVDSMMLETILALLGLATCALVLVSFWGSDLFGSRTRKRS